MKLNVLVILAVMSAPWPVYAQTQITQGEEVRKCYATPRYAEISPAECIEQAADEMNKKLKQAVKGKLDLIHHHAAYNEPFSMEQGGESIKTVYANAFLESQTHWERSRDSLCHAVAAPSGNATDSYNAGFMQCIINLDYRRLEELTMMPPAAGATNRSNR
ncbi:lysozyme inhibitor LprI family protein [Kosakonia sp. BYX6]|uniref:Lysozyme inhibitor LprI family protein n=1 Tax=Kosakonia calanthes TaxID=3139408 RepID=A0ABZ3B254_9ENTR